MFKSTISYASMLCVLAAAIGLSGCSKDQSTNYITYTNGGPGATIVGRALAQHMPVTIEAWQKARAATTATDDSGYYSLSSLDPGVYTLKFESSDEKKLEVLDIPANEGQSTAVPTQYIDVMLFTGVTPQADISRLAPRWSNVVFELQSCADLNASTFARAITIDPPANLYPHIFYDYQNEIVDYKRLILSVSGGLLSHTTYVITIDTSLQDNKGFPLASPRMMTFTTDSSRFTGLYTSGYPDGTDSVVPPGWGGSMYVGFNNSRINIENFRQACTVSPNIPGDWYLQESYYQGPQVLYRPTPGFRAAPGQVFTVSVDANRVIFDDGSRLGSSATARLKTDVVRVTTILPPNGSSYASSNYVSVGMWFNTEMDTASVRSAVTARTSTGEDVPVTINWTDDWNGPLKHFYIYSTEFSAGRSYVLSVSTAARSIDGFPLSDGASTSFSVF